MENQERNQPTKPETGLIVAVVILSSMLLFVLFFLAPLALGLIGIW